MTNLLVLGTALDLLNQIDEFRGLDIEFKKEAEDFEGYTEEHIRGTIVNAYKKYGDTIVLVVSFEKFDEDNRQHETANYYGPNGSTLTARQAGYYKVQEEIYIAEELELSGYFSLLNSGYFSLLNADSIPSTSVLREFYKDIQQLVVYTRGSIDKDAVAVIRLEELLTKVNPRWQS